MKMNFAASCLAAVKPSASATISELAKAMKLAGHDVIDLGLGEPDFDTPSLIVDAACDAARSGQTRYPPTVGTVALREAIAAKLSRDNNLHYGVDEVIVSNGAKQIIYGALMASMELGQEVILCAPFFGSYKDIVLIQGGVPIEVICPASNGFKLTPEALEKSLSSNTRWLLINSPCNPSGASYTKEEFQALEQVLLKYPDVLILSDEIYEHIMFDGSTHVAFAAACPALHDRILTVNGVSKAYAMTGWRIGYGAGHKALISAMTKVQSQISSGACSVAQAAAVAALNGPQESVEQFRQAFESRRNLVVKTVAGIEGLTLDAPGGAFYAYIGCAHYIGLYKADGQQLNDDVQLTQYLLDDAQVAAVPGSAYGLSPFFRISTAASEAVIKEALERIAVSLAKLTRRQ